MLEIAGQGDWGLSMYARFTIVTILALGGWAYVLEGFMLLTYLFSTAKMVKRGRLYVVLGFFLIGLCFVVWGHGGAK